MDESVTGLLVTSTEVTEQVLARKKIEASEALFKEMVTAEVEARKKIEESKNELKDLFWQAPVSIIVYRGPSFIVDIINEKALEGWGKSYEQVINQPMFEISPEIQQYYEEPLTNVYMTGNSHVEKEIYNKFEKNGRTYEGYYNFVLQPVRDLNGTIIGVFSLGTEVTQEVIARKKIEENESALRKTKEQLELSINAGNIGTWRWDVKNNVVTWSQEQKEMYGITGDDFTGSFESFYNFIVPEDREKVLHESTPKPDKAENQFEFRIRRTDGEIRWIQARSKTFYDKNGQPDYVTGINTDITQQKRAEEKIKESEEKNRLFIKHAPVAMAMFDKEMRYVSVSKK
jgi:PAS domain S-box-containing protein